MLNIPGYTLRGALPPHGANLLFHVEHETTGQSLILKTPVVSSPGPREFERYRRELGILQRLQGVKGVVQVHACEQLHDRPFLLLEKVEGRLLSGLMGQPFEVVRVLDLAISLCSALAELHCRGIIHKDLKPSNILVAPSGAPWLINFGSATLQPVEHVEAAPASLAEGTLAYMSPEQTGRMNRALDYRTDFYSLGVTLYELLTGGRPLQGRDALEWFHAHMAVVPPSPLERVPELPPVLSAIVMKLLAKVAEERYQSAEGLRADLERCRDNLRRGVHEDFPLGVNDLSPRFQLPQRLYGRDAHVATLLQGFERVAKGGRPELLLVRGYSGSGKSAVVHELHKPVVRQRGFFLSGKFDQLQQASPYATLAQAIRGLTQQLLAGSDEELARWRGLLVDAWEGHGQVLVDVVPQLELVVGEQPPCPRLPPSEAQHRFNRVFREFLGVFASPEHPLVVFLDDLQWADQASLQLLHHLLTHPETPPVLLLGAWRDNEIGPSHPLTLALAELREAGARMTELQLEPLSLQEVRQLVTDTLPGAGAEIVEPLSALAREKTGGNPFFLRRFLLTLHEDGLLVRTPEGGWRWDAEAVRRKGYSDNVVDFMAGKLRQLPLETQHLLRLAACVGNVFPLQLLARVSGIAEATMVERGLEPAFLEGLLVHVGPEQYRFLHDRIQQVARDFIPAQERKVVHLRIGRLLLESLTPEEVRERLFDVVSQFNVAAELLEEPGERLRVARLNAEAGWRAKASTAFRSASAYLATAFRLMPGDPWETEPDLAFKLRLEHASCEFMSGNAAEARRLVEELQVRTRTLQETAAAYGLKTNILMGVGDIQTAVTNLLEGLALMGMPMSPHPSWEEVVAADEEVRTLLGNRSIESLLEQPFTDDPDLEAMMSMLGALFAPAYVTDSNLLILHLCRMVSLSLRHGNMAASVHGYSWYGIMLVSAFRRYREARAFGQLACGLVERHGLTALRGKALYGMEIISYWNQPLSTCLELIRQAFQSALQASDIQIAGYCSNHIVTNRLSLGHDLEDVYQESVVCLDFVSGTGFVDPRNNIHFTQRYVQQLRGLTPSFSSMSGDDFDEETFEASLTPERTSTVRCWYWIIKMQSRFMCGAYREALSAGARARELLWSSLGHIQLLDFHLFRALSLAACLGELPPGGRSEALELLHEDQRQLAEWASVFPGTFHAPERLVFGELARVSGRQEEAFRAYEEALHSARAEGFIQYAALASELAARFWRERRMPSIADSYARQSHEAWLRWGARGKARQLEASWPQLASHGSSEETDPEMGSTRIDALTVVKAQQAISGEIVLERLTDTLLRVAIENAGAQRGALLLPDGDKLSVVASAGTSPEGYDAQLPWPLVSYVKRTREHVLIGDATQPHPFSSGGGLEHARSVLCLPLLRQEEFRGVLYLENNLATHAFTPERLALLGQLASQAAISIENARLYAEVQRAETALRRANDELEKRVEERTRELKQAQSRLVDTARAAGMAEVAANVLHNVGNVLTSAVINLQTMREMVGSSRMGRLKQVTTMLEEHRDDLADFLTREPTGSRLTSYLSALADALIEEQGTLQEGLEAMGLHIEHIRAIVHVQQSYASSTLVTEECDLALLLEDALSIQRPMLQRHGITVTRGEFPSLPKVRLDKHKVLQILVNLFSNAKNATQGLPAGQRHLSVRLDAVGDMARIQVEDNGVGIAHEHRERLFAQGFTTREDGHGLGLHSSALAAKMLGGRLTLESEGPGKGATATLELPL